MGWSSSHVLSEWQLNFPIQTPECTSIALFLPGSLFKVSVELGASVFFLSVLKQTHQNLCIQISCCPLHNCSLRRLNSYLDAVAISQTQKDFTTPLFGIGSSKFFWKPSLLTYFCLLRVNLIFGSYQKIWHRRNQEWCVRSGWSGRVQSKMWPQILLVSISRVFLGEQSPRQGTPKQAPLPPRPFDPPPTPTPLQRNKCTDFENSGG